MPNPDSNAATGVVFELQRWSIHDGLGTRTVVFFKGCPLRCLWCCNPESQIREPQIALVPGNCIDCGSCTRACQNGVALPASQGGFREGGHCLKCGACVDACPAAARQWMGRRMTVRDVMTIIERDMVFYRRSGGGVTFSGGEPLAQPVFLRHLLEACQALGISTALETCGHFQWQTGADILKSVGLVFLDIKHMDPAVHARVTGVSNELILENAVNIARADIPLIIRIPVIPSLNDDAKNIKATAEFVARSLAGCVGIEIMPYHALGKMKYAGLGLSYELGNLAPPPRDNLARLSEIIAEAGVPNLTSAQGWGIQPGSFPH